MSYKVKRSIERTAVESELKAAGYEVVYGGNKGHGWWIKGLGWTPFAVASKLV